MSSTNKPHSRKKTSSGQSVNVQKTDKADVHGKVGSGSRPSSSGKTGRPASSQGQRQGGTTRSSASSLLSLFFALPNSLKLIVVIGIVALFLFGGGSNILSSFLGGSTGTGTGTGTNTGSTGSVTGSFQSAQPSTSTDTTSSKADLTVSELARDKRVTPLGKGKDTVTIMIYMCGTDLESKYAMATKDLQEMINADLSDKVNIIVETGGCKKWQNNVISRDSNQIYQVVDDGLQCLEEDFGDASMTDPDNLTDFIKYCTKNYPANRNVLIFWDHGGGSITGYGYDELHPNSGSMTLVGMNEALKNAGCVFDWIGFDACLMATLETALVCGEYADYLIASEETEPGTGWYYTDWLTTLSKNTSISTVELAECLIDDFVKSCSARELVTLSVVDLAELEGTVPDTFKDFSTSVSTLLSSEDYTQVSNARAGTRQFAESSQINQIDLVDFANRVGTDEAKELVDALKGCIKYNNSTITNAYGLSIFFPYETLNSMNSALATYDSLDLGDEYAKCIKSFASMEKAGQITATASTSTGMDLGNIDLGSIDIGSLLGSSGSPLGSLLGSFTGTSGSASSGSSLDAAAVLEMLSAFSGRSMPAGYEWVDTEILADTAEYVSQNYIDPGQLVITWKDNVPYLSLTEKQWEMIQTIELNVFLDDGEGYIDMGLDNVFTFEGDDLSLDYDRTWLTVNGQAVAYYLVSDTENPDGSWTTIGRIPAMLNGTQVNLTVVFDDDAPEGVITGAAPVYSDADNVSVQAKGSVEIAAGDEIRFLCDYYDYEGNYSDSYYLGETLIVDESGLTLANSILADADCSVTYRLTDVYGNEYWTPAWVSEAE